MKSLNQSCLKLMMVKGKENNHVADQLSDEHRVWRPVKWGWSGRVVQNYYRVWVNSGWSLWVRVYKCLFKTQTDGFGQPNGLRYFKTHVIFSVINIYKI